MLLLSFAAQDPSSQLAASFLLLVQSSCIQKWFQASNESQTLPSDPPRLCSSFAAASSSLKTPALQPCGKLRRERRRQQATSEAVGGVQAGGLQPSGDLWRCQPKLCNVGDGSPCFEHVQQRRKCLSINNMFVVSLLACLVHLLRSVAWCPQSAISPLAPTQGTVSAALPIFQALLQGQGSGGVLVFRCFFPFPILLIQLPL